MGLKCRSSRSTQNCSALETIFFVVVTNQKNVFFQKTINTMMVGKEPANDEPIDMHHCVRSICVLRKHEEERIAQSNGHVDALAMERLGGGDRKRDHMY